MNTRSYLIKFGTKIWWGASALLGFLEQVVLWPAYCRSYITDFSKPFMTKWFSYILCDFHISYMICSVEYIVFYHYFMIDITNFDVFVERLRFWPEWTIYHFNCTYVTNSNIYLRTQSMLNILRNSQGSDTHFLWQKKNSLRKSVSTAAWSGRRERVKGGWWRKLWDPRISFWKLNSNIIYGHVFI